jgi:hypothetical protein
MHRWNDTDRKLHIVRSEPEMTSYCQVTSINLHEWAFYFLELLNEFRLNLILNVRISFSVAGLISGKY